MDDLWTLFTWEKCCTTEVSKRILRDTRLDEIKKHVEGNKKNLCKSRNRARSLLGILAKQELLKHHLIEFETLLKVYENRLNTEDWNRLTDDLEFVRTKINQSLKLSKSKSIAQERIENKPIRNSDYCYDIQFPALGQGETTKL